MNLLEMFKNLTEEEKEEFIDLICEEINKKNKIVINLKNNDISPVTLFTKACREAFNEQKNEEKKI